ncbi:MAG: sensor histidine kinase [Mycobacteriales bacterium]
MAADRPRRGWWRRWSLRVRLTAVSTLALALALAAGAVLLVGVLERSLVQAVDQSAHQQADDVAALVRAGHLPDPLPGGRGTLVQVVDGSGRVRAASAGTDRLMPLVDPSRLGRARMGSVLFRDGPDVGLEGPVRVAGANADNAHGRMTVLVAVPVSEMIRSVHTVVVALAVGTPLLLFLLAGATWLIVGYALRPVTALREGAEENIRRGKAGRLPVPDALDEVGRLAVTLNDMLDRLAAATARQRAFTADAAHELRSPLTSMRTQLEVALHHPDTQDWPETANAVLAETLRLSRLTDDLLLLARLDDARRPPRVPLDLGELAREVADRYPEPRVPIAVVAGGGPVEVEGVPGDLERVVTNLVDNALRHAASAVTVTARAEASRAVLAVADDGPGIPAADRDRVFDRFTRLDDARDRDGGGTGLGLPIVAEIVRAHGGTVELSAPPGLTVTVRLALSPPSEV